MNKTFLFYWFTALFLSSCSVYNSNKLLSDSKDPSYTIERVHPKNQEETIQSGDELSIKIYPNDGENALMSIASINAEQATAKMEDGFTVSSTGEIRIPLCAHDEFSRVLQLLTSRPNYSLHLFLVNPPLPLLLHRCHFY